MRLTQVIAIKIIVTICFWCLPLLLAPKASFQWVGIPFVEPVVFLRLLGAAYAALVVAYYHGRLAIKSGGSATATVQMGLVSNGLAALILAGYGLDGAWATWPLPAQIYLWLSCGTASLIAIALAITGWSHLVPVERVRESQ